MKSLKEFTNYLQTFDDVHKISEENNPTNKRKVLIVFDNIIADMKTNKKPSPIVTKMFLRGRKLNISLVFISQLNSRCLKL